MLLLCILLICGWIGYQVFLYVKKAAIDKTKAISIKYSQEQEIRSLKIELAKIGAANLNYEKIINEKDKLYLDVQNRTNDSISRITSLYSDFLLVQYQISEKYLRTKPRPAKIEANRIKDLKKKTKLHLEKYRQMLYKYEYLLQLFPELTNFVDDFESLTQLEKANSIEDFKEDYDRVQNYVDKDEYLELSLNERNQLALQRYIEGKKTNWQIGRDYELFCGLAYEKEGWNVQYFGMEKKLEDLGRDLIARNGDKIEIIQCKYWSQRKVIHEKHILQLYGTTKIEEITKSDLFRIPEPVFISNISLSETAKKFADILKVRVVKMDMKEFPRIKCNIGTDENGNETKIYHLPFDQQYDRTKIVRGQGFYAENVDQADAAGYRRAYKYRVKRT